jgi:Flp pilus assembly CpaE family ATPase
MELFVSQPALRLHLSSSEQVILEAVAASAEIPTRVRKRAGIILSAAAGVPNSRIAHDLATFE